MRTSFFYINIFHIFTFRNFHSASLASFSNEILFFFKGNLLCLFVFNQKTVDLSPSFSNILKCLSLYDIALLVRAQTVKYIHYTYNLLTCPLYVFKETNFTRKYILNFQRNLTVQIFPIQVSFKKILEF